MHKLPNICFIILRVTLIIQYSLYKLTTFQKSIGNFTIRAKRKALKKKPFSG